MRPIFRPGLVNGSTGDPVLFVGCMFERRALLFDLGDIRALPPRKMMRISHAFITHAHMDHFIGFDGLLRILLGREKDLHLYGPPGFLAQVEHKLHRIGAQCRHAVYRGGIWRRSALRIF